jgi:hypothetical protein
LHILNRGNEIHSARFLSEIAIVDSHDPGTESARTSLTKKDGPSIWRPGWQVIP